MGCSDYNYAGTLEMIHHGWLLIPKYAQDWVGTDKLEIEKSGEYADFVMLKTPDKTRTNLDGHVLSAIFKDLYEGETPKVSLNECYYDPINPYDDEILEDYRTTGIFEIPYDRETPYSIKVVKDKNTTYETTAHYSTASQNWLWGKEHPNYDFYDEDDSQLTYDPNNPRVYDPELWDYYYSS